MALFEQLQEQASGTVIVVTTLCGGYRAYRWSLCITSKISFRFI